VFLSYAREDAEAARRIAGVMKEIGWWGHYETARTTIARMQKTSLPSAKK